MFQFALAACAALLLAAPANDCPDQIARTVEESVIYGRALGCAGIQTQIGGVPINTGATCPSFVLVTPQRTVPESMPGSNTFVRPVGTVDSTLLVYTCEKSYLLFIPLGASCVLVRESVVAQLPVYGQFPCADLLPGQSES